MKKNLLGGALSILLGATAATAGSLSDPIIETPIIVEDSSASSGGGGVMAILLISLAAVVLDKR